MSSLGGPTTGDKKNGGHAASLDLGARSIDRDPAWKQGRWLRFLLDLDSGACVLNARRKRMPFVSILKPLAGGRLKMDHTPMRNRTWTRHAT